MDARHLIDVLSTLSAADLRRKIEELDAERESIKILLRAAIARERCQPAPRDQRVAEVRHG